MHRWIWILAVVSLGLLARPVGAQTDLPSVTPVPNPDALPSTFVTWDWETFSADFWLPAPDPLGLELPDSYMGTLPVGPFDLTQVRFVDDAGLTPAQQTLLAQNGFVVVPATETQFEDAYRFDPRWDVDAGHGYWVTTDALLHALHVAFINLLNYLEIDELYGRVFNVVDAGYETAYAQYQTALGTPLEAAARAAALYYATALGLLDPDQFAAVVSPDLQADAAALIDAAQGAEGRLPIPFLPGYDEDFSQYRPRGSYASSDLLRRYFRAMMWLGRITFLARDDQALSTSLLILRALDRSGALADWDAVTDTLAYLIGPTDNLGPNEYLPLARALYGDDLPLMALADPTRLAEFRAQVSALPGPRIHNVIRPQGTAAEQLDESTRGFRLFGQRFTFDGYAMQRLIFPHVGLPGEERALPSGLDIAAVMGSDRAYDLLVERGDTAFANYDANLISLRQEVNQISAADWLETFYGGWMLALQPLWNRPDAPYPALMNSDAWRLRELQTGLASWAELKHATILYTVQPMGGLGGGGELVADTTNYVEPNPLVFSRIAIIAASVVQGLEARGMGVRIYAGGNASDGLADTRDAFSTLAQLSAYVADLANKHLWGVPLTDDEQIFLKYNFGSMLWNVRYLAELSLADPPDMAAIVTDVANNPDAGTMLQVGTGHVDYIYVITDSPQGLQLTRGTVYSYYEFVNDIDNRLTDETWWTMVASGSLPLRPDWIRTFYAE